jgi:hypothetical protein
MGRVEIVACRASWRVIVSYFRWAAIGGALSLTILLASLAGCSTTYSNARHICGPLSVLKTARRIDLRVNDLRHCRRRASRESELPARLGQAISGRLPEIVFVPEDADSDLFMIFTVNACRLNSRSWTLAIDAWLPAKASPTEGTFAAIVEVHGSTPLVGDFVQAAAEYFAALRAGKVIPPSAGVKCVYGLNASD